jgi:hypothetical protein
MGRSGKPGESMGGETSRADGFRDDREDRQEKAPPNTLGRQPAGAKVSKSKKDEKKPSDLNSVPFTYAWHQPRE